MGHVTSQEMKHSAFDMGMASSPAPNRLSPFFEGAIDSTSLSGLTKVQKHNLSAGLLRVTCLNFVTRSSERDYIPISTLLMSRRQISICGIMTSNGDPALAILPMGFTPWRMIGRSTESGFG